MRPRLPLLVALALLALALFVWAGHRRPPEVAVGHVAANDPGTHVFRAFLIRDLTAYLKPIHGDKLALDYELLRDGPTQSGLAYPKYYLWLNATNDAGMVMEGVARVAAVDQKGFRVTDFVSRSDVISHPESLTRIFPQALIEKIQAKAGVKK
ncbi:MAG: hypothetical protein U1G08_00015 [Verrucomicrobiota bacterium]|mgnify:CR=1 FL=1